MGERDKDAEILALRHQVTVLQRQLGDRKVRSTPVDRTFLAALLSPLPRAALRRLHLLVRPDTVPRWHRDLLKRRHAKASRGPRPGRPHTMHSIRILTLRLVSENPHRGYRRIHGQLAALGIQIAPSPSGRSSRPKASTRHRNAPRPPGLPPSAPRRTRCRPATSSRPSP
jgi:hypothetical protein